MRLAFSVAAHLDPDILIVDEVLAVGDSEFQKKCLGKMQEIGSGGRTVLFVSHSMQSVTSLCNKCILLEKGTVKQQGTPSEVVLEYFGGGHSAGRIDFTSSGRVIGDDGVELLYGEVLDNEYRIAVEIDIRNAVYIRMGFRVKTRSARQYVPNFHFTMPGGTYAFVSSPQALDVLAPGDYEACCMIPGNLLNEGTYSVGLAISSFGSASEVHFFEQAALSFNVRDSMENSVGRSHGYGNIMPGVVRPLLSWTVEEAMS